MRYFNPRTRTGYDCCYAKPQWAAIISIHVPARGTTVARAYKASPDPNFNPRTRTGYDVGRVNYQERDRFQSTYPHGVRPVGCILTARILRFQSTYPHGVRRAMRPVNRRDGSISIHVPARGTTHRSRDLIDHNEISIHVPARGTTSCNSHHRHLCNISIHVPARGTTSSRTIWT